MRRLIAAATLAALGFAAAVPLASAHDERWVHEFAWTESPNPSTAPDGSQVYSNGEVVAAKVYMSDGVKSWDVVIRPANGGPATTCHEDLAKEPNTEYGRYPTTVYINCPWDTTRAKNYRLPGPTPHSVASKPVPETPDEPRRVWQPEDLGPSVNGKYTIEITAVNAQCPLITACKENGEVHPLYERETTRWREVWVVNGVATPAGVAATHDAGAGKVAVTWARNPEPDVSYIVQEKGGDGKWSAGANVGNATRFERAADPGTYQFRVAAQRPAPTRNDGEAIARSDFVAASVEVVPPPPTTAPGPNNASGVPGGADPGVFIPETPTSTSPPATAGSGSRPGPAARPGSRPGARSSGSSRSTGSTAPRDAEAEGMGPDEGFSSVLPYTEPRDGFIDDLGEGEEEEVSMLPGVPVPKPRDTRALIIPMAAGLALFVLAMQGIVYFRRRPAMAGPESDFDDFDDWLRY